MTTTVETASKEPYPSGSCVIPCRRAEEVRCIARFADSLRSFSILAVLVVSLCSEVWAIGTWTFVDGGSTTGINSNTGLSALYRPAVAAFNGELYVAWTEPNAGVNQIRVRKYTPDDSPGIGDWTFVDGGGLNRDADLNAQRPSLVVHANKLYVAWDEYESGLDYTQIQVREYAGGTTWSSIQDSAWGLNHFETGSAEHASFAVFNGTMYATWDEVFNGHRQIRVKRYDGGTAWTFVDHSHSVEPLFGEGINYDPLQNARFPRLVEYDSHLYAVWNEDYEDSGFKSRVRVKRYDGGLSWTSVSGSTGLNYVSGDIAEMPSVAVFDGQLYVAWYEGYDFVYKPHVRVKRWNGSEWDGPFDPGPLDWEPDMWAFHPAMISHNHVLYFSWDEEHGTDTTWMQIRVKKYNGSSFSFIDGNGPSGINYYATNAKALEPSLAVLGDTLYVAWLEPTEVRDGSGITPLAQVRVKKVDLPSATITPDIALVESNLDARYIDVALSHTTFDDTTLSAANFALENAPAGLTIESLSNITVGGCRINLAFAGTDFDTTVTNLGLTIAGVELDDGDDLTASNVLPITAETIPAVTTTDPPSALADTSATVGGDVTSDGNTTVTERGIEYKKSTEGAYATVAASSAGTGVFEVGLSGLTALTEYNARSYATNREGTTYGNVITFTTTSPTALTLRSAGAHRTGVRILPLAIGLILAISVVCLSWRRRRQDVSHCR